MKRPNVKSLNYQSRVMVLVSLLFACWLASPASYAGVIPSCIGVTKTCNTVLSGQPNLVTVVVTNCGSVNITGISVVDNLYGNVGTVALLSPGGTATLTKSVTNTCGTFPNVVTATGVDVNGTQIQAQSTNVCVVTENPCINVTKTCDTVLSGHPNLVTVVVTNCGDVPIHGITIVDNIYGSVGTVALLAPGGTATLTKSVTNTCGNFPNVVTATGLSPCNTQVQDQSTNVCVVTENPCIGVTKTCNTVTNPQPNLVTAVVTNCGNVPLHGITVVDNLYGNMGTVALLAPGGTATLTKSVTNTCGNFPNVVTVTGLSPCNTQVQDRSTNVCTVVCLNNPPVAVCTNRIVYADANCQTNVSVDGGSYDPDGTNDLIIITQTPPGPYPIGTNSVTLCVTDSHGASNCCNATVTVLGARGIKAKVLGELIALRASVTDRDCYDGLDDAIRHLTNSLAPNFWIDETHLNLRKGVKVFYEEREAVEELVELLDDRDDSDRDDHWCDDDDHEHWHYGFTGHGGSGHDHRCNIPDAVLQRFIDCIVKADRLLAVIAVDEAEAAGARTNKIAQARREIARGDKDAARDKYEEAIDHYRNAWKYALLPRICHACCLSNGRVHLEIVGEESEFYSIQASTDLVNWVTIGIRCADDEGLIEFEEPMSSKFKSRFYRVIAP